ncbi:MAG: DUF6621 family protein [Bacteroidaceae bacterium]
MVEDLKFTKTVILIDVPFLLNVINVLKKHFEEALNRTLQEVDVSLLVQSIAFDMKIAPEVSNEIQVLMIYDELSSKLPHCVPSDLKVQLNGVAFRGAMGEFSFFSFQPEGFTSTRELFTESVRILTEAKEVKQLCLVAPLDDKDFDLLTILDKREAEQLLTILDMGTAQQTLPNLSAEKKLLGYVIMEALGIRGDEV